MRSSAAVLLVLAGAFAGSASAQQPATPPPPAPAFAASNLTEAGVRSMVSACAMCHGTGGTTVKGSNVATLAGRRADSIVEAMKEFKDGKRSATIMHQIAKGYSDAEIAAMAAWLAKQP
jgi:cytochrome subunit of sulfide dehydrogenase